MMAVRQRALVTIWIVVLMAVLSTKHISYNNFPQLTTQTGLPDQERKTGQPDQTQIHVHQDVVSSDGIIDPPFAWNRNIYQDKCFYVEDICHSSHRWFYRERQADHQQGKERKKQPNILLYRYLEGSGHNIHDSAYQQFYRFEHSDVDNATQHCVDSPITNHLVTTSVYNGMLGEFYLRELYFLYILSQQGDWVKYAQHYIHLQLPNQPVLDSHHLFTSAFRTLPLLAFTSLLDEIPCTCLPRLILCGYSVKKDINEEKLLLVHPRDLTSYEEGWKGKEFRSYLKKNLIDDNLHVQEDIKQYRMHLFDKLNVPFGERNEWKVVGLAQRNMRRSWRNLTAVISEAQTELYSSKILLVEINVESKISSSYRQIVHHGALDGLVGIHGSQLTEAIWMKPYSWVIELLPYIPEGIVMGSWTRTMNAPTPIGMMYDNTDLNHVGYPLSRDSAPYCYEEEEEEKENPNMEDKLNCWRHEHHRWDERDFILNSETLEKILRGTIAVKTSAICQDYVDMAGEVWVLYNINCVDRNDGPIEAHHYYWNTTR